MDETPSTASGVSQVPPPFAPPQRGWWHSAFFGPNGLRAGCRLLIFLAILFVLFAGLGAVGHLMMQKKAQGQVPRFDSVSVLASEATVFLLLLLASWIMARIEGRKIADYGLPWKKAFDRRFWQGALIGFAAITVLLLSLSGAGVFHFGTLALHGVEIWKYAIIWALAFLAVGFFEEFTFRGYALFTLTSGIGFWPSAIILSALFGAVHYGNPGETWLGAFSAGAVGLLFCLILRRTGDLWMAIGFHAAWDWGETFFFGVPDSGAVAPGHLFNSTFAALPVWLTGGTVGPEGSWLCILLLVVLWFAFAAWLRGAKYPDPTAIPDPRRRGFDSSELPSLTT
jgi:uncharacterized protein